MTHPLFSDTVTLYHRTDGGDYARYVLRGVQWRQKTERAIDGNGKMQLATMTSVTIPAGIDAPIHPGGADVMVLGVGPELTAGYTIAQLRRDDASYCTVRAVSDNRLRSRLKHRKVKAL